MFVSAAKPYIRYYLFLAAAFSVFFFSCTIKDYPANTPFVYKTNINLQDNFSTTEKKGLTEGLDQQLHDSMRVRWVKKFLVAQVLKSPPVYDSSNAVKSIVFMKGFLTSLGYYRDSINYSTQIDTIGNQYRTTVNFNVVSAKLFKLDSISYNLLIDTSDQSIIHSPARDTLQKLTNESLGQTFIKKGDPFSTPVLSQEINRLSDIYRDNGFLRYTSDEMLVLWDTVGLALLRPTLDPIEQAQQLEKLRQRRLNPTADVEFRLRTSPDSARFIRYYIGKVRVFPDLSADTALYYPTIENIGKYQFISYPSLFKNRKLVDYIYLRQGELYKQSNYLKTQNKFNALTAWRLVTITPYPRIGQDTVDFDIKLTPSRKYQFSANLEGSRNMTTFPEPGNLLGLGINLGLQNRNFARAANLAVTNLRYGIELNGKSAGNQTTIQTQQYSLSNTIQFPRKVPRELPLFKGSKENVRTILGVNLSYTDRYKYYTVQSVNTSWGYEKTWGNKLLGIRFPNIEYYFLNRQAGLLQLIDSNKSYRYIFNKGLVLSTLANYNRAGGGKNVTNLLTIGGEISGFAASLIPSKFLDTNLYRFVKLDAEFRQTHRIRRSAFAWRIFGGLGYGIPTSSKDSLNLFLPFFRQYFVGGPNSMRAWGVRRLGPGSSIKSFTRFNNPDRFGDMRLEANAEYRFYLANISGVILNGALFTDIGNVWFLRKNPDFPDGEFRLNKLWKDIAIGAGTGLRVDFGFLKLRFEYAYKVKNPTPDASNPAEQNKWFYNWQLMNGQFQLGIDYPF
jgi:outer membrane protein insertion porin family